MADYRPQMPFSVPMRLLMPVEKKAVGVVQKEYPKPEDSPLVFCSFRTFGGTESVQNGVLSVVDTAVIETWYREDIKANCRLCPEDNHNKQYDILGTPENINMRNQFLRFKVQAVSGGA